MVRTKTKPHTAIRFRPGFPARGQRPAPTKAQVEAIAARGDGPLDGEKIYNATLRAKSTPCGRVIFHEPDKALVRRQRIHIADDLINALQFVRVEEIGGEKVETV